MIAKLVKGRGFRGALEYDITKEKGHVIGSNMAGQSPRDLASEFGAVRKLRPNLGKAVMHVSLSAAPGEHLTDDQWREVGERYIRGMGLTDNQYVMTRHHDTDHEHIHIVANRITHGGEVVSDAQDWRRQEVIMREIEQEHGLQQVAPSTEAKRKAPTKGEIEQHARTGEPSTRQQLQQLCEAAAKGCGSFTQYQERLEAAGVELVPVAQQGGAKLTGLSYRLEGVTMKGSDLGRAYTAAGVQKRGITYEQDRDLAAVRRSIEREADRKSGEPDRGSEAGASGERRVSSPDAGTSRPGNGGADRGNTGDAGQHPGEGGPAADRDVRAVAESRAGPGGQRQGAEGGDRGDGAGQPGSDRGHAGAQGRSAGAGLASLDNRGAGRGDGGSLGRVLDLAAPTVGGGSIGAEFGPAGDREASAADTGAAAGVRALDGVAAMRDHITAKQEAWAKQAAALDAEQYRITLMPRREGLAPRNYNNEGHKKAGEPEKFWTAAEVAEKIPQLARQNARGYDVYVTPIDSRRHYLVIDDMTSATLADARRVIEPALVQESSRDNYQAVVIVPKDASRPDEQSLANGVVHALNQKWGDPRFNGVIHPFRMAGFSNQKPGRDLAFTRIVETRPGHPCPKAKQVLEASRSRADAQKEQEAAQRATKERERRLAAIVSVPDGSATGGPEGAPAHAFRQAWNRHRGLAEAKGWQVDSSKVDYRACKDMLAAGWSPAEVRGALVDCSPSLADRHSAADDYARRTVDSASQDPQVIRAVAALERDHDHAPG